MTDTPTHPALTRQQLMHLLELAYGTGRRGGPDTQAIASDHGVSRRTVQRWLQLIPGDEAAARIPGDRMDSIWRHAGPTRAMQADERGKAAKARQALEQIALPRGRGVEPIWRKDGWLEQHVVAVIDIPSLGLRRPTVARMGSDPINRLQSRGVVVDMTIVANRFAAAIVKTAVLEAVQPWRVRAPRGALERGGTETWLQDAPVPDLAELARRVVPEHVT